ncbi:MAG: hypothetical protein ACRYG8_51475 [Janthinobacterium lividum]
MIQFYARGFITVTGLLGPAGRWARRHPRWAAVIVVAFFYLLTLVFGNAYAYADDNSGKSLAPFLPGGDIVDSKGVALNQYAVLPLDRGDMLHYQKTIITSIVDFIWVGHLGAVAWMISFLDWLLSFEWVKWLATPFDGLATVISAYTGEINWIPFALMLTGLVAFIAIAKGRYAGGFIEILLSCVCAVLAAGLLANPVASLTATGGALEKAQSYGSEIAAAVVSDGGDTNSDGKLTGADILSKSVTTQLADIFIRTPAQTIAFGHALTGNCDQVFTDTMKSDSPAAGGDNTVRDKVGDCDEEAKNYVQNPNMGSVATAGIISTGGIALFLLAMGMALLFIVTVFFFLIEAIKTQWNVLLGVLPISRAPLWKSFMGMIMGLVSIIAMVVVMAAYLKILISILNATASLGIVMQMQFVNVVIVVLLVLLWRVRAAAKKAGVSMAEQLSKLGLSTGTAKPRDRSMAIATMGQAANYAINRMNRPKSLPSAAADNRSINFYGTPAGRPATPAPIDLGEMSVKTSTPTSRPSGTGTAQKAVTAPQTAARAQKAASVVYTATKIAKAAPGGPTAMAGQAAIAVGSSIVNKKTESATKAIASRTTKAISAPATPLPEIREIPQRPAAIVVDSKGVGHIQRNTPTSPVPPAPAATKPAVRSPRSIEMRQVLAATKTGQ